MVEGGSRVRVLCDGAAVQLVSATASARAGDELGGRLVPQGRSEGEIFLVLARLLRTFNVEAVDVEGRKIAGTGAVGPGPAEVEGGAKLLAIVFPPGLDSADDVGDSPAVDGPRRLEEVVEELGDLVRAQCRGQAVPEDEVDLVDVVRGVGDVEDGVDAVEGITRRFCSFGEGHFGVPGWDRLVCVGRWFRSVMVREKVCMVVVSFATCSSGACRHCDGKVDHLQVLRRWK